MIVTCAALSAFAQCCESRTVEGRGRVMNRQARTVRTCIAHTEMELEGHTLAGPCRFFCGVRFARCCGASPMSCCTASPLPVSQAWSRATTSGGS